MKKTLPKTWKVEHIGNLCDVGRGSSPRPIADSKYFEGGTIPWIKIADATKSGKYLYETKEKVNEYGASFSRLLPRGSLIVAASGTLGYTQFLGVDGCIHDGWLYLTNFRGVDKDFLYYFFIWKTTFFYSTAYGTAIQNINTDILREMEIILPPLHSQHNIASILSAYDDLIENNLKRIKILEEMAQMTYMEWFVNFRFPGHEKVKMVKSEFGIIPEGWKVTPLEEICKRITDGSHSSPKSVSDGLPIASVKDMHDWGFEIKECRKIGIDDYRKLVKNDCKPLKNDVLIAKDGSYLKHVFVMEKELDLVILSSIAILRPNERVNPYYLALYLKDPQIKAKLKGFVSGVALPRIILKDFRKFKTLLPPVKLQEYFAEIVAPIIDGCWRMIDKNENLRKTRDLLLHPLISGKIDVEHLDINTN
jgi:type I restriction enzyme S subunit